CRRRTRIPSKVFERKCRRNKRALQIRRLRRNSRAIAKTSQQSDYVSPIEGGPCIFHLTLCTLQHLSLQSRSSHFACVSRVMCGLYRYFTACFFCIVLYQAP